MTQIPKLHRQVVFSGTILGVAGATLAALYATFTIKLVEGTLVYFFALVGVATVAATLLSEVVQQRGLRTVRKLVEGARDAETLRAAFAELHRIGGISYRIGWWGWGLGVAMVAVGYPLYPGVSWSFFGRIMLIGLLVAPLLSVVTNATVSRDASLAVKTLVELGLTAPEATMAVPTDRGSIVRRFVTFSFIVLLCSATLVLGVIASRASVALESLLGVNAAGAHVEAIDHVSLFILWPAALCSVVALAMTLLGAWQSGESIGLSLTRLADGAAQVAGGTVGAMPVVPGEGEIWAAIWGIVNIEQQLSGTLKEIQEQAPRIAATADQLEASSTRRDQGSNEQASALQETSSTTELLAESARRIADSAAEVQRLAAQTLGAARAGKNAADGFGRSMSRVRSGNQAIAASVVRLNKRVQQVGRVVEFIDGIADRADLLAVNAELEGARAGAIGKGFSLVAADMRRLSESVLSSTQQITKLIEEIRDATNAAVMATEAGVKTTDRGTALANDVATNLSAILDSAALTSDAVRSITLATQQQRSGTDQLSVAMSDILTSTLEGKAASAQLSESNQRLFGLADQLRLAAARFKSVS